MEGEGEEQLLVLQSDLAGEGQGEEDQARQGLAEVVVVTVLRTCQQCWSIGKAHTVPLAQGPSCWASEVMTVASEMSPVDSDWMRKKKNNKCIAAIFN